MKRTVSERLSFTTGSALCVVRSRFVNRHFQEQTPGYPHGDGICAAPACEVAQRKYREKAKLEGEISIELVEYDDTRARGPTAPSRPHDPPAMRMGSQRRSPAK